MSVLPHLRITSHNQNHFRQIETGGFVVEGNDSNAGAGTSESVRSFFSSEYVSISSRKRSYDEQIPMCVPSRVSSPLE